MAIYLTHQYGTRFYGPEKGLPNFDPSRFSAYSIDYRTVHITWAEPEGEFQRFRLVKSRWGYPITETDGQILVDDVVPPTGYDDPDVVPGSFVYYGAFLQIANVWFPVGIASTLHIRNLGSIDWLWARLPIHYRIMRGNRLDLEADTNEQLARFMGMFGWGLDRVRTGIHSARRSYDATFAHEDIIDILIAQFGLPAYPGLSGARKRALVRDSAALLAERGTEQAMIAAARAASGWDLVLRPSPNLILTADQSTMTNPRPPEWDETIVYAVGNQVWREGAAYVCKATATGYTQKPSGDRTANTWWNPLLVVDAATAAFDLATSSQHGWQGVNFTSAGKAVTELALGVPVPLDPAFSVNAVTVKNTHTATSSIGARLLPEPTATVQPVTAITYGIPLPEARAWSPGTQYEAGTVVTHNGRLYQALRPSRVGSPPSGSDRWCVVGTDTRTKLTLSAYTHQPHTDTSKPTAPAQMYVEWYDARGNFISRDFGGTDTRVLDTFANYATSQQVTIASEQFTVSASTNYDLLVAARATAPCTLSYVLRWYNSSNGLISSATFTPTASLNAWKTNTFQVTSPSGAAKAQVELSYTITDAASAPDSALYVDSVGLGLRNTQITNPTMRNANALFEATVANWTVTGGTLTTSSERVFQGASSGKIVPNTVYSANANLNARVTEYGGKSWTTQAGAFIRDGYLNGVARPQTEGQRSMATVNYGSANATVAATLATPAPSGMVQAVVLRLASATSYMRATRTSLQTVNGATVTDLATYAALADGDRLTVRANGTTITVLRNGVQIASVTSSFNSTATVFGLAVEA